MKNRFVGESGRQALIDTLRDQKIVAGNTELATEIAASGELLEIEAGSAIIQQGGEDSDIFLIVTGSFDIVVNGRVVASRFPNDHVGEMAAIQHTQRRSATVVAREASLVVKFSEARLVEFGNKHPDIWRRFAKELARRLEQRNALVTAVSEKIRVFIISSAEALEIARSIQNAFDHDPFSVTVWTDGVFQASYYAIESLERALDQSDVAIAVAEPDDITESRGKRSGSPRDNVIFELGFFMGRLGRHRTLLVEPRGEEIKLPTDLAGINTITYKYDGKNLAASLATACNKLRAIIEELGPNR
jgi:CRP/FNR family transcriptional regulator, cyclic AMP receptor protein